MSSSIKQKTQLKAQLFTSIQGLGLQDQLKKQLRIQICEKLKERDLIKKPTEEGHQDKLYNRIIASIISEELKITDCGYSNSIYVAQSGFDLKILQRNQIIQIMGILEQDLDSRYSILGNLIKRKYPFNGGTLKSTAIQTSPQDIGYTLEQRLALIDQQYRRNIGNSKQNKEQVEYKKKIVELESDLKRAYQKDVERFKQFQAHNIKVRVSQEWRKKFQQYAQSISEQYSRKMQHLRKKQKLLEDNIVNKTKVLDQKTTNTHKNFLQKIQLLQIKSNIATETQRNLQIERKRTKQQYIKLEDELKSKKRQYDNLLLNLNDKISYEVGVAKLAVQQEYQEKNEQFLNRKKFIDEEYGKLMGIKDTTDVIKDESKRLYQENIRLRKDLTELQQELRISMSQNAGKGDRLETLRAELNQMQRQKIIRDESLRQQIKKSKNRESEISQLRHQLDQLRQWKEKQQKIQNKNSKGMEDSLIDDEDNQRSRQPLIRKQQKSEMAEKLQALKEERKKYIQRLKMQII